MPAQHFRKLHTGLRRDQVREANMHKGKCPQSEIEAGRSQGYGPTIPKTWHGKGSSSWPTARCGSWAATSPPQLATVIRIVLSSFWKPTPQWPA